MTETTPAPEPKPSRSEEPAGYIPRPPRPEEVKRISEQQALITDEWTGDAGSKPPPDAPPVSG